MAQIKKNLPYRIMAFLLCLCMFTSAFSIVAEATDSTPEENTGTELTSSEEVADPAKVPDGFETSPDAEPAAVSDTPADGQQSDARNTTPKVFHVDFKFQDTDAKTLLGESRGRVKLNYEYDGQNMNYKYDTEYATDGVASFSLTSGKIYMFDTRYTDSTYFPDMDSVISAENGVYVWIYVDENGPEPINGENIDRLMGDPNFSNLIDSMVKNPQCYSMFMAYLGIYGYVHYPDEEKLKSILPEYIDTFPNLIATQASGDSYEITLNYSKREPLPPFKIVAVDEQGRRLAGAASTDGPADADGVVFDSVNATSIPVGFYPIEVRGVVEKSDGTVTSYVRKNAAATPQYPAGYYSLILYVKPDSIQLVTPDNFDELSKDPQFKEASRGFEDISGNGTGIKAMLRDYSEMVIRDGTITLPFTPWQGPTITLKTVDIDRANAPLAGMDYSIMDPFSSKRGETESDGMIRFTAFEPGPYNIRVSSNRYEYMASHEMFRFAGKTQIGKRGEYRIILWVKMDGTVEVVDDTKLKELCTDKNFIDLMTQSSHYSAFGGLSYLAGVKADYSSLKKVMYIPGDYTLDIQDDAYLLPFSKQGDLELSGIKDETAFAFQRSDTAITVTYDCPEDGTYRVGWDNSSYYDTDDIDFIITGPGYESGETMTKMLTTVPLQKGTYTFTLSKKNSYVYEYFRVFVEKITEISPAADLHTADYIKDGSRYSNMVSFSCGTEMEHLVLARYPGAVQEAGKYWAFNVALPSGADYQKGSLKLYYLPNSGKTYAGRNADEYFGTIKDELKMEDLVPLKVSPQCTPAESFSGKTIFSMSLKDIQGVGDDDLIVATYTSTVNTAAWYSAIVDSNMSYGYWTIQDTAGKTVETYDEPMSSLKYGSTATTDNFVDPAICQVFGIKIYKYSNYDRMLAESESSFDNDVLMQEHLLAGAKFKIEGENLSKIIVIRDDLVELEDKPAAKAAMLRASQSADKGQNAGAVLAQLMGEETMMKLLYYRYEQGLQDLSNVSVAQTQTYYALNEDNLYTRAAPQQSTMEFYADNGQGYQLKPTAFSAKAGDTIQAGDGGGLLLGGLGVGKYTLTEVEAPEGYTLIEPMEITIEWVRMDYDDPRGYTELAEGEVPDRSGDYGLLCMIDGVLTPSLTAAGGGGIWVPGEIFFDEAPSYESIWNPICFVLVNPIGDDRISFGAVKEVNDPGDKQKEFKLKITIKDPDGNICTDVKYAISNEDGQYVTQDEMIDRAEDWIYTFKPGEKIAFVNLLEGSTYEVTEEDGSTSQYVVSYKNKTGTIQYGTGYPMVTVTNKKGEVIISKTVTGSGSKSKRFTFELELTDKDGNALTDVTYVKGKTEGKVSNGGTLQLKHGESVKLYLPIGAHYTVKEVEANQDGYTTMVTNGEGTVSDANPIKVSFTNRGDKNSTTPSTGDASNMASWFAMLIVSAAGLVMLAFVRRKKFDEL